MKFFLAAIFILISSSTLAAGGELPTKKSCNESISMLGISVASIVYNFGEILDDSGYNMDPSGTFKAEFLASLCKEGCTGFCKIADRPKPDSKEVPTESQQLGLLLARCGTYGGDHCISSISKLPRFPKDFGIQSQQTFYVFGCMSGGPKACKELLTMKGQIRKLQRKECIVKKNYEACPRYAALLVANGETKKAHEVLQNACKKQNTGSTCIALNKHIKGPATK
jgi:hypothetical protein